MTYTCYTDIVLQLEPRTAVPLYGVLEADLNHLLQRIHTGTKQNGPGIITNGGFLQYVLCMQMYNLLDQNLNSTSHWTHVQPKVLSKWLLSLHCLKPNFQYYSNFQIWKSGSYFYLTYWSVIKISYLLPPCTRKSCEFQINFVINQIKCVVCSNVKIHYPLKGALFAWCFPFF